MKQRRTYIAGKISGIERQEALRNFALAEVYINCIGRKALNPMCFCSQHWSWVHCMIKCLFMLAFHANEVYLQPNWMQSRVARLEVLTALLLRKKIHHFTN